jgi:hypothetical protein
MGFCYDPGWTSNEGQMIALKAQIVMNSSVLPMSDTVVSAMPAGIDIFDAALVVIGEPEFLE